ncbi:MAG: glycosyltransferase, partial [Clostridia bacterium]|nr:glycosyltransferase [Clostridia bacterium]
MEVLIVDDGSTDKTGEIGKDLEAEYPEIVHYIYKENGG